MKKEITVTLKFFSGLDKEVQVPGYDPSHGISVQAKYGARLRKILKTVGLKKLSTNVYFCNGERIGLWKKLRDGSEISCLKPSAGG